MRSAVRVQAEPIPGVGVKVAVGMGVLVGVIVNVGVEVNVGVGVIVGPNTCPGPQPETRRLSAKINMAIALLFVFMVFLS